MTEELSNVGNIVFPVGEVITAIQTHIFDFLAVVWVTLLIALLGVLIWGIVTNNTSITIAIMYITVALLPSLQWGKLIKIQRAARLAKMGYQYGYKHQYPNRDFISEAIKSKINRL